MVISDAVITDVVITDLVITDVVPRRPLTLPPPSSWAAGAPGAFRRVEVVGALATGRIGWGVDLGVGG